MDRDVHALWQTSSASPIASPISGSPDAMAETSTRGRAPVVVIATLVVSLLSVAVHAIVVRPHLWPAGAGVTLSGDSISASLSQPSLMARIRPPDVTTAVNAPLTVTDVMRLSEAARIGIVRGMPVSGVLDARSALLLWRDAYRRGPSAPVRLVDPRTQQAFTWRPQGVWRLDHETRTAWLHQHAAALVQMVGFLAGAVLLVVLGSRGTTASLVTLAMMFTALANAGSMLGAEFSIPWLGPLLVVFGWSATALSFPVIGLAVLHFPTRAPILERHRWIYPVVCALPVPLFIVSLTAAAFLLGLDAALTPLAWFAANGWVFDASFTLALAGNVAIVIEGIRRYRENVDPNERRRIQMIVYRRAGCLRLCDQGRRAAHHLAGRSACAAAMARRNGLAGDRASPRICPALRGGGQAHLQSADRASSRPAVCAGAPDVVRVDRAACRRAGRGARQPA
jgi:hypothetical protein